MSRLYEVASQMGQMHHIKPLAGDGDHKDSYLAMFKRKRIDKYRKTRY